MTYSPRTCARGVLAACFALLASCTVAPPGGAVFTATDFSTLTGWTTEQHAPLVPVFLEECRTLAHLPPETYMGGSPAATPIGTHAGDWAAACTAAQSVPMGDDAAAKGFFEHWFTPYQVTGENGTNARFTGYFEPEIRGSLERGGIFQTPLYARPNDLIRAKATNGEMLSGHYVGSQFQPYDSRAQIDAGSLNGRAPVLMWLADPIDLFFLQIQGSGRVRLVDGQIRHVGYDGRNGQPYVPLGRVLVQQGALASDQVSMQSIRAWLVAHPDDARQTMEKNPNYVFFRVLDQQNDARGAPGALGVPLTPSRSLAVDRNFVPLSAPVWVETKVPLAGGQSGAWNHLAFAQDLGAGIKGPTRADLYLGWGPEAERMAGNLHADGQIVVLLPKADASGPSSDAAP